MIERIPVLDLKEGQAVYSTGGIRAHYQPLQSPYFSDTSLSGMVAQLAADGFNTLYCADLDAITGNGDNSLLIEQALAARSADFHCWLDAGIARFSDYQRLSSMHPTSTLILGSETLSDHRLPAKLKQQGLNFMLSLDFKDGQLLGDNKLLQQAECWPDKVIVLCLDRIGSRQGPDWPCLDKVRRLAPRQTLIYGGGVRGPQDFSKLQALKVRAVLSASFLYRMQR